MAVTVRPARSGDGAGISRAWLSAAVYYADLDPEHFQVPDAEAQAMSAPDLRLARVTCTGQTDRADIKASY